MLELETTVMTVDVIEIRLNIVHMQLFMFVVILQVNFTIAIAYETIALPSVVDKLSSKSFY